MFVLLFLILPVGQQGMTMPNQTSPIHGKQLQGAGKGRDPVGTGQLAALFLLPWRRRKDTCSQIAGHGGHQQCFVLPCRE